MSVRRLLLVTVALAALIAAAATVRRLRTDPPLHAFQVVERLVDRVASGADPQPRSARYHWSADEIGRQWKMASGEDAVMLKSPELALDAIDDIDSIAVTLAPSRERVLLLWNAGPTFSRADLLRNRRELFPSPTEATRVIVRGEDIRGETLTPLKHLFLHLPGTSGARGLVQAIEVFTRSDRLGGGGSGRIRFGAEGELRDAVYTRSAGTIEMATDIPRGAALAIGLRALNPSDTATARISVSALGRESKVFEGPVTGRMWQNVRVPLPAGAGSRLRFDLDRNAPATVVWGNPMVLAPDGDDRARRPNVVLYVVDALRADRLGLYGSSRSVSPFLDELAGRSLVFDRAYAAASWTKPSVTSLLTSTHPQTHSLGARFYTDSLPDAARTLQDHLRDRGYLTAQFSANPLSATLSNLDQGFDDAFGPDAFARRPADKITAEALNEKILPWLEAHREDRFFMYVQSLDPHGPLAPVTSGGSASGVRDPYDAAVASSDRQLQRLYQRLVELGLDRKTLFIVTSDHGEAFGEHGRAGHGQSVYEEEIHVPLVLHLPDVVKPGRVELPVSAVDVLPTILDLCSIPYDRREIQGRSLAGGTSLRAAPEPVFVSTFVYPEDLDVKDPNRVQATAIIQFPWKLIVTGGQRGDEPRLELYDLSADPKERRDVAPTAPDRVEALRARLRQFLADQEDARRRFASRYGQPSTIDRRRGVPRDVLEQLKSLGYVR
jgi:arylsulfatase A-like enzyme